MRYYVDKTGTNNKNEIYLNSFFEALSLAKPYDEIVLCGEVYYGKFYIKTPNLTITGINKPTIHYDARNGETIRECDGGDGVKTYGTTGSASVTVLPDAKDLKISNVRIKNSYIRDPLKKNNQNVAFKTSAKGGRYFNIDFIGSQDTLYIDESDNIFDSCYIEGDVDFIFGSGDAIIKNSVINMLEINNSKAYLCAPNTYTDNKYGFVFYNCYVRTQGENEKYLGRAWYPSGALRPVKPRCVFYKCHIPKNVSLRMITMHEGDPVNFECYTYCIYQDDKVLYAKEDNILNYYINYLKNND